PDPRRGRAIDDDDRSGRSGGSCVRARGDSARRRLETRPAEDRRVRTGAARPRDSRVGGRAAADRAQVKDFPYWWDTVSGRPFPFAAPERGTRDGDRHSASSHAAQADVAIVGAGYTGLSAARHLARAGASVIVLERERAGWGASSRNGGQVLTGLKLDASTL